jgi:hypothetical protein
MARSGGRIPKRSSERRRRNKVPGLETVKVTGRVKIPALPKREDGDWHPLARKLYNSLRTSGQAQYFEPSDWAMALAAAEYTTRVMSFLRVSAEQWRVMWDMWESLLMSEAARRRARIEIEREVAEAESEGNVTALDDYKRKLGAS